MQEDNESVAPAAELNNDYTGGPAVAPMKPEEGQYIPLIDPDVTEDDAQNFIFFKHKQIQRFEIPRANAMEPFKFVLGICKVAKRDEAEFREAAAGLSRADSGNIVMIRNIQNEVPISMARPVRGPATTETLKAHPTQTQTASQSEESARSMGGGAAPVAAPSLRAALNLRSR